MSWISYTLEFDELDKLHAEFGALFGPFTFCFKTSRNNAPILRCFAGTIRFVPKKLLYGTCCSISNQYNGT